jgi:NAD(P)-dependent dehydrogenase (short-subunit alcohol dehydrogenase family)
LFLFLYQVSVASAAQIHHDIPPQRVCLHHGRSKRYAPLSDELEDARVPLTPAGIGKQTAIAFARHGITRLALADVNKNDLDASIAALKEQHPSLEILPLHLDVRDGAQVKQSIADVARAFGRLDVAVNNAGISGSGKLTHETEDEEIDRVLDVNLRGVYRCRKEELAVMVKQEYVPHLSGVTFTYTCQSGTEAAGKGEDVSLMWRLCTASSRPAAISPTRPTPPQSTVRSPVLILSLLRLTPPGVIGLTKGDANAYASYNIRINAISPGYVATPLIRRGMEAGEGSPLHKDIERTPLKRLAEVDEIADAIVWLSSPMNSFAQGSTLVVDGGFTSN